MTVALPYQQLVDARDNTARGGDSRGISRDTLNDVLALIKHAAQAATLCACALPRQGECSACQLDQDLRVLMVPRKLL